MSKSATDTLLLLVGIGIAVAVVYSVMQGPSNPLVQAASDVSSAASLGAQAVDNTASALNPENWGSGLENWLSGQDVLDELGDDSNNEGD